MGSRQQLRDFPYEVIPFDIIPTTGGDHTLRAAVANKHIVVLGLVLVTHGDVEAAFYSGDSTTASDSISGVLTGTQIHGVVERDIEYGLFWTEKGKKLVLNLDTNVRATGRILTALVDSMPPTAPVVV